MLARKIIPALLALATLLISAQAHAQEGQLIKYCKPDIERLCAGVEPGGGRLIQCLKTHKEEMTVGCALALKKLKGRLGK
ncbi:MAG TPA: cysteine rich repeat-containing protein [Methylocystis sp.]|nr:cysteine rich repeat-containing protein [Methylocystis sp.]